MRAGDVMKTELVTPATTSSTPIATALRTSWATAHRCRMPSSLTTMTGSATPAMISQTATMMASPMRRITAPTFPTPVRQTEMRMALAMFAMTSWTEMPMGLPTTSTTAQTSQTEQTDVDNDDAAMLATANRPRWRRSDEIDNCPAVPNPANRHRQ